MISQLKQEKLKFKVIRHKKKKYAFHTKSPENFKETDALVEGHFILSSGLHSDKYVQCAKLLSKPHKAKDLCLSLSEKIKENFKDFNLILSPAIGGIVIGYEIGRLLDVKLFLLKE